MHTALPRKTFACILMLFAATQACASDARDNLQGLVIGSSTMQEVMLTFGEPDSVYLSGRDGEGEATEQDAVMMVYRQEVCVISCREARLTFSFHPTRYTVKALAVEFDQAAPVLKAPEVEKRYGADFQKVGYSVRMLDGDLEGVLERCCEGECAIQSYFYPKLGLSVYWENDNGGALSMQFTNIQEGIPSCGATWSENGLSKVPTG